MTDTMPVPPAGRAQGGRLRVRLPGLRRPVDVGGGAERPTAAAALAPKPPHFPARAKRVIFLCMEGGPSHVDTFDYKPKLTTDDGKAVRRRAGSPAAKLLASPWKFSQHGQSGLWISELFPEVAKHADDLCVDQQHAHRRAEPSAGVRCRCTPAAFQFPRPSLGAWALYGLGHREREPARLHHDQPAGQQRRAGELRQRVPAGHLPGDADRVRRGPAGRRRHGRQHHESPEQPGRPAAAARLRPGAEPRAAGARDASTRRSRG